MKNILLVLMVLFVCLIALPGYGAVVGKTDEEVRPIVDDMLENVLSGFSNDNYLQYSKDFDSTLRNTITSQRFQEIRDDVLKWVGSYLYREYLGFLNREANTVVFWKGVFDKTQDEILIKMVVSERNGQYFITGLWYQ